MKLLYSLGKYRTENSPEALLFIFVSSKKIYHGIYLHISGKNPIDQVQFWQKERALQFVVVKWNFSRTRAVQPSFHEGSPGILQHKFATNIIFAHSSSTREDCFATVMFNCILSEEEVGEIPNVIR